MRTAEDVFALVGYHRAPAAADLLDRISATVHTSPLIANALPTRLLFTPGVRSGRRLRFRVVTRMIGEHEFRRVNLQSAVERAISARNDHTWRLTDEGADVEFWATLLDREFFLAIRLSDSSMRSRDYKVAHMPGSLRPSVAAALGMLSDPQPEDIVLDPFCGVGTILIERAHLGRYARLIGGDRDDGALAMARENLGSRYQPIALNCLDATAVPMPQHSVTRIITNLPWGMRHGSHAENRRLYPRLLTEFRRLIHPRGRIVMLTAETRLMGELLRKGALHLERSLPVTILGARAAIYICRPADG
jgi:23S rRNA G2445 N2-methylase RlmL